MATYVAACGPFDGAPVAVRALLSGYNFGISVLTSGEGMEIGPYLGGTFYLLPRNASLWGPDLVTTVQGDSYSVKELPEVFQLSGMQDAAAKISTVAADWSYADPGVQVVLVAGSQVKTELSYQYDASGISSGPKSTTYGSGDGTVPLKSALLPSTTLGWSNITATQLFPNVAHVALLADSNFLTWLVGELQSGLIVKYK